VVCFSLAADVVIRERLDNVQKVEHENVKLHCKIKNPKNYAVSWLKDGKPLAADNRYVTYTNIVSGSIFLTSCRIVYFLFGI